MNVPEHEVINDGVTVWVNASTGECIGRFGRMGIDIHQTVEAQLESHSQCLECTHGPTTVEDWDRFRAAMLEHYGIEVPVHHMPKRFRSRVRLDTPEELS